MKMVINLLDGIMYLQYFLIAWSEVSENFRNCRDSFYKGTPPYLNEIKNAIQICQRHKGSYPYFATNYNSKHRIPHYSAYSIRSFNGYGSRLSYWYLEPQLADNTSRKLYIVIDHSQTTYKKSQAIGYGEYDRGHLNPNSYNKETDETRAVTNSMTNIAPQNKAFNNGIWNELEQLLYNETKENCNFAGARRYFITGVIPSRNTFVTNGRVNVPDYFWTAMCCDSSGAIYATDRMMGWSAAFLGANKKFSSIYVYTIEDFLKFLARKTSSAHPQLFAEYVNGDNHVRECLFNQKQAATKVNAIVQKKNRFYKQSRFNRICNAWYCAVKDRLG